MLAGEQMDLDDWEQQLKPPFDPYVVTTKEGKTLRSSLLDAAETSKDVLAIAGPMFERLNGTLSVIRRARPVHLESVIEFKSDGTTRRHSFTHADSGSLHIKGSSVTMLEGGNGAAPEPLPLQRSETQRWLEIASADKDLADALQYYLKSEDWYDTYNSLECLYRRFGGETEFLKLGWESKAKIKLLWRTANCKRHSEGHPPPPLHPMEHREARDLLGKLLSRAFQEAGNS